MAEGDKQLDATNFDSQFKILIRDACIKDNLNKIYALCKAKPTIYLDEFMNTCAEFPCPKIFKFLLKQIVDVNVRNADNGLTALHVACGYGNMKIVKMICGRPEANINIPDNIGNTPLHAACKNGKHLEIVRFLCCKGADKNAINLKNESPLIIACKSHADQIVEYLLMDPFTIVDPTNKHYLKYCSDVGILSNDDFYDDSD